MVVKGPQVNEEGPQENVDGVLKEQVELKDVPRSSGDLAIVFQGQKHKPCEVVDKIDEVRENHCNFFHF